MRTSQTAEPRPERERGSATLETVIVYPALLLLIFGIFQASMYYHAHNVAHGAATLAYHSARAYNGSASEGQREGLDALRRSTAVIGGSVSVTRTATTTTVTVTGRSALVVPGFPGSSLRETVTGPSERYVAP